MSNWKSRGLAKVLSWFLLTVSVMVCAAGGISIAVMEQAGVYEQDMEKTREDLFRTASRKYSLRALKNELEGTAAEEAEYFKQRGFRYGIIKADSIEQVNLNRSDIYLDRNFTESIANRKDLYIYSMPLDMEHSQIRVEKDFLFDDYYYEVNDGSEWVTLYVDSICYEVENGIFYYCSDEKYYPVSRVDINRNQITYSYEYQNGSYLLINSYAEYGNEIPESEMDEDPVITILTSPDFTFNKLDQTDFTLEHWKNITLDEVRTVANQEIMTFRASNMEPSQFCDVAEVYLDEHNALHVNRGKNGIAENYIVVSYVDEESFTVLNRGASDVLYDMFFTEDQNWYALLTEALVIAYRIRFQVIGFTIFFFLLGLGCFFFAMSAAGHQRDSSDIQEGFFDRIPFDLYTAVYITLFLLIFCILDLLTYNISYMLLTVCIVVGVVFSFWLFLSYCLSIAVRVKKKRLLRNTIIYKLFHFVWTKLQFITGNAQILWKAILVMVTLGFIDLLLFQMADYGGSTLFFLLIAVFKIALYIFILRYIVQLKKLQALSKQLSDGNMNEKIQTDGMRGDLKELGENLNHISEGMTRAVEERIKSERMKTELITNVSHDIKTPLTSIINYVDLMTKEDIQDEKTREYLEVLDRQSSRLKKLIDDLVEASKASSGCLAVHLEQLNIHVILSQIVGEFEEKLNKEKLELVITEPDTPLSVEADSRHLWRVIENLMNNVCKYAQSDSRVYLDLYEEGEAVCLVLKNMSRYPLNITSEELMERFVRGDKSRNTEGHGLGLSIARSLTELMGGALLISIDGDLFKATLVLKKM